MRIRISIIVSLFMLTTLGGLAHGENLLKGRVYENHGDTKKLAIGAQIWIVHIGNPYTTGPDGAYQVLVPDAIRFGQTIELYVKRRGWAIATPVGGKVELSKELTTDIVLSPEASSEFLSSGQLDKLLESLPEKLKGQVKPDSKEGSADPAQVVKEYAIEHGLPEREVITKVAALVKQYDQSSDLDKQCLAARYRNDLMQVATQCKPITTNKVDLLEKKRQEIEALSKGQLKSDRSIAPSFASWSGEIVRVTDRGKVFWTDPKPRGNRDALFVQTAERKSTPAQLEEARRHLIKLTEEVVGEFKATGDTYYANYQFDKALATYKEGLSYVGKKDLPTLWADMQWQIGSANWQIGIRTKEAAIKEHLTEAVNRYGEAATVYTRKEFPEAWAAITNNLGNVLSDQGTRTDGEAGTKLLAQAVDVYQAALSVRTKEAFPQQWAMIQNNLGFVLWDQGTRTGGKAGTQLLAQAVAAYTAALTVYTKATLPQDWAMTQNNLGLVLREQGTRTDGEAGTKLLAQAVNVYQAALSVRTKETFPQQWAMTQNNLGNALSDQGARTDGAAGTKLLAQAVAAYRTALTVYTKEALPQQWAMTQNNLGVVLADQGARTDGAAGTKLFAQAITAYTAALTVYTKEALPQDWAMTKNNLGTVLRNQGTLIGGEEGRRLLREAIEAYQSTLQIRTKHALPVQWEATMTNLKEAKKALADMQ